MTKIDKQIAEQLFDPKRKVSWRDFVKVRMGPYMRKYGGHGPAIRQIAKEWKEYNKKRVMVKAKSKHKPKSKSKPGSWLDFVKSHSNLRTAKGLLDLKAISKLWKMKSKAYDPGWNKGRKNTLWNRVTKYRRQTPRGTRMEIQDVRSHDRRTFDPGWNRGRKNTLWNRVTGYRRQEPIGGRMEIQDVKSHQRRTYDLPDKYYDNFHKMQYWVMHTQGEASSMHETPIFRALKRSSNLDTAAENISRMKNISVRESENIIKDLIDYFLEEDYDGVSDALTYDPAPKHSLSKPPSNWYHAMLQGIKKSSDVRNPGAIVGSIWRKLSPSKKSEIKARDAKGERFQYDLPLPDDRPTRGTGTLRMVKPFKLAEVQVNLSIQDYMAALKSGLFSKMKRNDGTIALVARCKSKQKNCNIFVDKR